MPQVSALQLRFSQLPIWKVSHITNRYPAPSSGNRLFDLDLGSDFGKFIPDRFRFFLGNAFLNIIGRAIHQCLGFFKSQACKFTDNLNYLNLLIARSL